MRSGITGALQSHLLQ
jgi:twinfilin